MVNYVGGAAPAASCEQVFRFKPPKVPFRFVGGGCAEVQFFIGDTAEDVNQKLKELNQGRDYKLVFEGRQIHPEDIITRIYEILRSECVHFIRKE